MHAAYASESETESAGERQGRPPDTTGEGREERDDVKRGKFWPRAPPPPNGMDLALTKDDQGERESEEARFFRIKIDWNMIRKSGARARRVL